MSISINEQISELNKKVSAHSNVITEDSLHYLENQNLKQHSLIISFPPLAHKKPNTNYPRIFDYEHQLLIESAKCLKETLFLGLIKFSSL